MEAVNAAPHGYCSRCSHPNVLDVQPGAEYPIYHVICGRSTCLNSQVRRSPFPNERARTQQD